MTWIIAAMTWTAVWAQWERTTVHGDVFETGAYPEMIAGADGTLHLTYWDARNDRLIYRNKPVNGGWSAAEELAVGGYRSALAVRENGDVAVAYFQNVGGQMRLRYAYRNPDGLWNHQNVSSDDYGPYGPVHRNQSGFLQASLALHFKSDGNPFIVFFDATYKAGSTQAVDFQLRMRQAYLEGDDPNWRVRPFPNLPYVYDYVIDGAIGIEIRRGARTGEFCQVLPSVAGDLDVWSVGNYNGHVYRFRRPETGNPDAWVVDTVDTIARRIPLPNYDVHRLARFLTFHTFEGLSVARTPDMNVHYVVGTSEQYGHNTGAIQAGDARMRLIYGKVSPDGTKSVAYLAPQDNQYRSYASLVALDNQRLFVSYAQRDTHYYKLAYSVNGGESWTTRLLAPAAAPDMKAPLALVGDTLHCVYYDAGIGSLYYGRRHVHSPGGSFDFVPLTRSYRIGYQSAAVLSRISGVFMPHVAYTEEVSRRLWLAYEFNGWTKVESPYVGRFGPLSLHLSPQGDAAIVTRHFEANRINRYVYGSSVWSETFLITAPPAWDDLSIVQSAEGDVVHLFYRENDKLRYTRIAGQERRTWTVDSLNDGRTGMDASASLGPDGRPVVVYRQTQSDSARSWKFARFTAANTWIVETIFSSNVQIVGTNAEVKVRGDGRPVAAARNHTLNRIVLAYKSGNDWRIVEYDLNPGGEVGVPVRLVLDNDGNPLVCYGFYNLGYDFRAFYVDLEKPEVFNVLLPDNPENFGGDFWLGMHEDQAYLFGRANAPGHTGLMKIQSAHWRETLISETRPRADALAVRFYPNPVADAATLSVAGAFTAEIFDLYGKKLAQISGVDYADADCSALSPGMYWCVVTAGEKRAVVRFVKR
jgi:hypothetical protein